MANEVQMNEELEPVSNAMNVDKSVVEELAEAKKEIANQYYSLKQYKKALTGYNEVIEMCSDEPRYYGNRAACYMMLGLYRNALVDAKKCIELDPLFLKVLIYMFNEIL